MFFFPVEYDEPLFRPPAESASAIIQITLGCSWNKCSFCEMYSTKKFKIRRKEDIFREIELLSKYDDSYRKFFLADGNALICETSFLLEIISKIKNHFPKVSRISCYALPSDILRKSEMELNELRQAGLSLLYVGVESGDDIILKQINKSENYTSTVNGLLKAKMVDMDYSLMIINGLGGKERSVEHAIKSADIVNVTEPKYLSTLVLSFPFGENHFIKKNNCVFTPLSIRQLIEELLLFIQNTNLKACIFRSDHVSNVINLKAVLNRDKDKLIENINFVLRNYKF